MGRRVGGGLSCVRCSHECTREPQVRPHRKHRLARNKARPAVPAGFASRRHLPAGNSTPVEPISIELFYWLTRATPVLRGGKADLNTVPGSLDFPGRSKYSPGGVISIPAGRGNALRISYFQTIGTGNTTAATDLNLFSTSYSQGDYLATQYKLRNVKISYDFVYPTPLGDSNWRFRTLWEVQYTSVKTTIDAPLKPISVDSSRNPDIEHRYGRPMVHLPHARRGGR